MESKIDAVRHVGAKFHKNANMIEIWFDTHDQGVYSFFCTVEVAEIAEHNISVVVDEAKDR